MPPLTDQLDLDRLGLKPGGGSRFEATVRVGKFTFGLQSYALADDPLIALVDVGRTTSGYVVRVRCALEIEGPCMRCSDDLGLGLEIDQSEIHEPTLEVPSDYVEGKVFDLSGFVRDAIGLALPTSIAGPLDRDGACEACDRTAGQIAALGLDDPTALESMPDPRWDKLRELEF